MSSRESTDDDDMQETVLETTTALPVLLANASEELRVNFTEMRGNETVDIVTLARYHPLQTLASCFLHLRKSGGQLVRLSLLAKDSLTAEPPTLVASVMPPAALALSLLIWRVGCKGRKRTAFGKEDAAAVKMDGNFSPIALFGCCEMTRSGLLEWLCCMPYMWADTVLRSGVFTRAKVLQLALVLLVFMWALPLLWQHLDAPFLSSLSQYLGTFLIYYALFQARRGMKDVKEQENDEVESFFWTRFVGWFNLCPEGTSASCMVDACAVVLCAPCTVAQEAQFQEISEMAEEGEGARAGLLEW